MLSCTSSDTLTLGKYQRVPQNLDNPNNGQTLEQGWALGHSPYMEEIRSAHKIKMEGKGMMPCRRDSL